MKLNSSFRIFAAVVFVLLAFAACSKQAEAPKTTASAAKTAIAPGALPVLGPAPSWKLKDVHGQLVSSEQFKGKVVVIDFWATWCGPCRVEIPGYIELQRKYGKDGLVVIGVSMDEAGPKVVEDFSKKMAVNYQMVMSDDSMQAAFGPIDAIPTTFLIDRAGQVRDRKVGVEEAADYEKKITALLN